MAQDDKKRGGRRRHYTTEESVPIGGSSLTKRLSINITWMQINKWSIRTSILSKYLTLCALQELFVLTGNHQRTRAAATCFQTHHQWPISLHFLQKKSQINTNSYWPFDICAAVLHRAAAVICSVCYCSCGGSERPVRLHFRRTWGWNAAHDINC